MPRVSLVATIARLALVLGTVACEPGPQTTDAGPDASTPPCPERPSDGLWASFEAPTVPGQPRRTFQVQLLGADIIARALALWQAHAPSAFPMGPLRCQAPVGWNCGWSWHLAAGATQLVESSIELCDAAAPVTEEDCQALIAVTGGTWCPWGATLLELRDCRSASTCPLILR